MTQETDHRIQLLNNLLTTPHRKLEEGQPFHNTLIQDDPIFYQQLAAWYNDNGDIRDHKQLFVANLLVSKFNGHRDIGLALLREMAPYQVTRTLDFIKFGLKKNLPRSVHTEVERYLKDREADNNWFDTSVLRARKHIKRMYALCHVAPSERADSILFKNEPPDDSVANKVKALVKANTPAEQAQSILTNKIPYPVAATIIDQMTPTVLFALIEVMSPQELINNMGSLQRRGAFNNADLKAKIEEKLSKVKTAKNVSALKSMEAIKANADLDVETQKQLADIADSQVKNKGRIKADTALFIDKSASMSQAIQMGKRVGAMISAAMADEVKFYAYAFDTIAYEIEASGTTLAEWQKVMEGIKARGGTYNSAPLRVMTKKKIPVEQIVMITDEGENGNPTFANALDSYVKEVGVTPTIIILRTYSNRMYRSTRITDALRAKGYEVEDLEIPNTDYYSEPTILQFLCRKSKFELLMEVMSYELPKRKPC